MSRYIVTFLFTSLLSASLCFLIRKKGGPFGLKAVPREGRWNNRIVPLGGGIAIYLSFLFSMVFLVWIGIQLTQEYLILIAVSTAFFSLGLVDDWKKLKPHTKLLWQILGASVLIAFDFQLNLTPWHFANLIITLFWIVGITNAFNLLDNMDGLAAGIAVTALIFRLLIFLYEGSLYGSLICVAMIGCLLGFLLFNSYPASIFMGDAGSLFIGFFMSGLVMTGVFPYTKGLVSVLLLPILILLIPIFDTTLVALGRTLSRKPVSQGGNDHLSHKLVAVGLSEREAVVLLYVMSAISGTVAFVLYRIGFSYTVMGICLLLLGLVCLGIYLERVTVTPDVPETKAQKDFFFLFNNLSYKREIATMLADVILIAVAYYGAYGLRFGQLSEEQLNLYVQSLPIIVIGQLMANYLFGLYRHSWRHAGIPDLITILKAIGVGAASAILLLTYAFPLHGFSGLVFVIYTFSVLLSIGGLRLSFRILDHAFQNNGTKARKVLIYGAGDCGEFLVREILQNPALNLVPAGFIDDDPNKQFIEIHGVKVIGDLQSLAHALSSDDVLEILISTEKLKPEVQHTVSVIAAKYNVQVRTYTTMKTTDRSFAGAVRSNGFV